MNSPPKKKGTRPTWEKRIDRLMKEFMYDTTENQKKREKLISEIKQTKTERDTDNVLYQRAYNKFKAVGFFL